VVQKSFLKKWVKQIHKTPHTKKKKKKKKRQGVRWNVRSNGERHENYYEVNPINNFLEIILILS